jgi:RNA polymerase sigma-70 factor (ECF subfamily)
MSTLHYLSDHQRELAEQNHGLVGEYLRIRKLDANEYYDVVIFGFLRAIQRYDEQPELQAYSLKTIAFGGMRSALYNHFRDLRRQKRNAVVYNFEELQEYVADSSFGFPPSDYAEAREQWAEIRPKATPKQLQALKLRAYGYSCREVGNVYRIAPSTVSGRIGRLRRKALSAA